MCILPIWCNVRKNATISHAIVEEMTVGKTYTSMLDRYYNKPDKIYRLKEALFITSFLYFMYTIRGWENLLENTAKLTRL